VWAAVLGRKKLMMRTAKLIFVFIFVVGAIFPVSMAAQAKLPASPIKTVYIMPTSHYDLGFVEPPDQVRERVARHIDEVIRVAEQEPRFRWTIESTWQIDEWLKRQQKPTSVLPKDKDKIDRLMKLIRSGQIAVSTAWGSMHTDFMGAEELNRMCYSYAALHRSYGIDSNVALMDDVPGHPTTIPSLLASSGTKYLVTGANLFLMDATSLAPGKVPFYWESPDGSRVLTWISASKRGGYTEGMTDFFLDPYSLDPYTDKRPFDMFEPDLAGKRSDIEIMETGITELLNRYNNAGYAYDAVLAYYGHDFVEPTNELDLLKAVDLWNSRHSEVQLKVATAGDFFKYIEGKYAGGIPTYRGEWSGLWSEAKTRSPKISSLARYAHDKTPAAETLWSALAMTRRVPIPVGNFSRLYDLMYGYDEHSGAGNNGWPQLNSLKPLIDQNREYVRDMSEAKAETDRLFDKGVEFAVQPTRFDAVRQQPENIRSIVVYNSSSWDRTDVVTLEPPTTGTRIEQIKDLRTGSDVRFDTDASGKAIFVAQNVPALGYSSFEVRTAKGAASNSLKRTAGNSIDNGIYSVAVRPDGNVESIRDLKAGRELVNSNGERPFNDLLRTEGVAASVVNYPVRPSIEVERGAVISRITIRRERSIFPVTDITVYGGIGRVDIHNELDPRYEGYVGGENFWGDSYYFAFPFNISKDGLDILRGGQKWFDRLPADYLPGARKDSVTSQHVIGLTDGKATAIAAHRQAFYWAFSSFVSFKPKAKGEPEDFPAMYMGKFPLPEATVYSRALRNASIADTHDKGPVYLDSVEPGLDGNYIFDYAFASEGVFDPVAAWRFGADLNLPLEAFYAQSQPVTLFRSFFSIDQPNVQIVDVKPLSEDFVRGEVSASPLNPRLNKVFIIRLQEFAGRPAKAVVTMPVKIRSAQIVSTNEAEVLGNTDSIDPLTVSIEPNRTMTIRVEIQ